MEGERGERICVAVSHWWGEGAVAATGRGSCRARGSMQVVVSRGFYGRGSVRDDLLGRARAWKVGQGRRARGCLHVAVRYWRAGGRREGGEDEKGKTEGGKGREGGKREGRKAEGGI